MPHKAQHRITGADAFVIASAHAHDGVGMADAWLRVPGGVEGWVEREAVVMDFDGVDGLA